MTGSDRRWLARWLCKWPRVRYRPLVKNSVVQPKVSRGSHRKKCEDSNSAHVTEKAMSTWAERVHRGAVSFSHVVTSCGHPNMPYPHRLDKVKFGVPLDEVCKNDIPGSLLVLILKLNKEAPMKKDVFRAPGHQANMKKLIHFLQTGRLVNIDNFSVYTIASVLKKFLRKLPNGIFGCEGEQELFEMIQLEGVADQRERIHRLVLTLPPHTQRLLVLLFGTFRVIAANAARAQTGMTSEALGVSVAPSFFHTCVSDGKQARMEDVQRFKVATKIMKLMIDNFGVTNLFGRENYEYYARITGRILKVDDDWIFSFRYPPDAIVSPISHQEESQSTPALMQVPDFSELCSGATSLGIIPENNLLTTESYTRLSTSLEENGLFKGSSRSSCSSANTSHHLTLEELRSVNRYAESTKSLSFLPQVHERQAARMRTRSEWFLTPLLAPSHVYSLEGDRSSLCYVRPFSNLPPYSPHSSQELVLSASADSVQKRPSIRRGVAKPIHRSSSKRNKENGSKKWKKVPTEVEQEKRTLKDGGNIQTYSPEIQRKCQKMESDATGTEGNPSAPTCRAPLSSPNRTPFGTPTPKPLSPQPFSMSYKPRI